MQDHEALQRDEMQPKGALLRVPLNMYQSDDRLTIAVLMPGLEPENIWVQVSDSGRLTLRGELRGQLKGVNRVLVEEWRAGGYLRELDLPLAVDATLANVTYGNGVLVVALPISDQTRPARLTLHPTTNAHGERVGNAGHPIRPAGAGEQPPGQ